jgi:hypothetical protein
LSGPDRWSSTVGQLSVPRGIQWTAAGEPFLDLLASLPNSTPISVAERKLTEIAVRRVQGERAHDRSRAIPLPQPRLLVRNARTPAASVDRRASVHHAVCGRDVRTVLSRSCVRITAKGPVHARWRSKPRPPCSRIHWHYARSCTRGPLRRQPVSGRGCRSTAIAPTTAERGIAGSGEITTTTETPRSAAAWCHVALNFPDSPRRSITSRIPLSKFS